MSPYIVTTAYGHFMDEIPSAKLAIDKWKEVGQRVHNEPNAKYSDVVPKAVTLVCDLKLIPEESSAQVCNRQRH